TMFLPGPREGVVVRRILSDNEVSLPYPGNGEALQHNRVLRASGQVNANDVPMASMSLAEDVDTTYRDAQLSARLRGSDKGFEAYRGKSPSEGMRGMPIAAGASMSNVAYSSTTSSAESAAQALVGTGTTQRKTSNTPPRTI